MLKLVAVFAGVLLVLQNVSAQCDCVCKCGGMFGSAEDTQTTQYRAPLVVRPQALQKPAVALPILGNSNAGPCYRKKAIVKPALVPKTVYVPTPVVAPQCNSAAAVASALAAAASALSSSSSSSSSSSFSGLVQGAENIAQNVATNTFSSCQPIDYEAAYQRYCSGKSTSTGSAFTSNQYSGPAPADVVSIDLAYKRAQKPYRYVNEDKLAFGFRKLPIDETPAPRACSTQKPSEQRTVIGNINEENLYSLNGQIVELKPVVAEESASITTGETLAEEAADELLDLEAEEAAETTYDAQEIKGPSLSELGYGPAKIGKKSFIDLPVAPVDAAISAVEGAAGKAISGLAGHAVESILDKVTKTSGGFKSGTVEYKTVARPRYIAVNPPDDHSCESQEEAVVNIPVAQPMCTCTCPGGASTHNLLNSYIAHRSTSSSSSHSAAAQSASRFVENTAGKFLNNGAGSLARNVGSKLLHKLF